MKNNVYSAKATLNQYRIVSIRSLQTTDSTGCGAHSISSITFPLRASHSLGENQRILDALRTPFRPLHSVHKAPYRCYRACATLRRFVSIRFLVFDSSIHILRCFPVDRIIFFSIKFSNDLSRAREVLSREHDGRVERWRYAQQGWLAGTSQIHFH